MAVYDKVLKYHLRQYDIFTDFLESEMDVETLILKCGQGKKGEIYIHRVTNINNRPPC